MVGTCRSRLKDRTVAPSRKGERRHGDCIKGTARSMATNKHDSELDKPHYEFTYKPDNSKHLEKSNRRTITG